MEMIRLNKLRLFIIGTTAVGKTKLSVQLAKKYGGQIISCDSKQLYKHASIMTAKVTAEQSKDIKHYMVDCLNLEQTTYNRNKYFKEASRALKQIQQKNKIPIIVGGTNYYIQTLLYNLKKLQTAELEQDKELVIEKQMTPENKQKIQKMRLLSKQQKYKLLQKYDSVIANKVYKNDEKKITIFLERIILTDKKISDDYEGLNVELKEQNSIIFWIRNSNKQQLQQMITKRINSMLNQQGLTQIFSVYYYINSKIKNNKPSQTLQHEIEQGACSSIGIKEFKELYSEVKDQIIKIIDEETKKEQIQSLDYDRIHQIILKNVQVLKYKKETLQKCRQRLILDTKQYCKRQITWIKNRMFVNNQKTRSHFFVLQLQQQEPKNIPTPILQRFDKQVYQRAVHIIQHIQKNGFGSIEESQQYFLQENKVEALDEWKKYACQFCKLELNGNFQYQEHIKSKKHLKQVKYSQKRQQHLEKIRFYRQKKHKVQAQKQQNSKNDQ